MLSVQHKVFTAYSRAKLVSGVKKQLILTLIVLNDKIKMKLNSFGLCGVSFLIISKLVRLL